MVVLFGIFPGTKYIKKNMNFFFVIKNTPLTTHIDIIQNLIILELYVLRVVFHLQNPSFVDANMQNMTSLHF